VAGVDEAVVWAAVEPLAALAVSAVRLATPNPRPVRPATVTPTKSIRLTTRFITQSSSAAHPRRLFGRAGRPLTPVNASRLSPPW
jgi:hypothetical protein